jgi:hypothetical protein
MEKEYVVKLTPKERQKLMTVVNKGQTKAAVIRRAHSLLKSDEGKSDRSISELLYIHEDSVRNTRKRFVEDGLQAALEDKAGPKREPKLNEQQSRHIWWQWRAASRLKAKPAGRWNCWWRSWLKTAWSRGFRPKPCV